jgi:predicted enzyme related to lactoylglutathione lyase
MTVQVLRLVSARKDIAMKNPAVWFSIQVDDMARARDFYERVFGVKLTRLENTDHEMWAFPSDMHSYGTSGALTPSSGARGGGNGTMVYFACEDCAIEAEKAARAGGRIQQPKISIGQYGHVAEVMDTEGNVIGLHSMR